MRTDRKWIACVCCVVVLGMATGCRLSGVFQGPKAATEDPVHTASRLTGSQVSDIQISLCRTLEQQGNLERARDGYRKLLQSDPKSSVAAWRLAVIHDRLGEIDKSEPFYRQAVEADAKNVELLADYGYSLYLKRRWAESEKILSEARRLEPKNARVQNNLGLLLAQTDRSEDALAAFRRAGCREAEAQSNLGLVLAINGRDESARKAFEKSLAIRGDGKTAKQGLTALQAKAQREPTIPPGSFQDTEHSGVIPVSHEQPGELEARSAEAQSMAIPGGSQTKAVQTRRSKSGADEVPQDLGDAGAPIPSRLGRSESSQTSGPSTGRRVGKTGGHTSSRADHKDTFSHADWPGRRLNGRHKTVHPGQAD